MVQLSFFSFSVIFRALLKNLLFLFSVRTENHCFFFSSKITSKRREEKREREKERKKEKTKKKVSLAHQRARGLSAPLPCYCFRVATAAGLAPNNHFAAHGPRFLTLCQNKTKQNKRKKKEREKEREKERAMEAEALLNIEDAGRNAFGVKRKGNTTPSVLGHIDVNAIHDSPSNTPAKGSLDCLAALTATPVRAIIEPNTSGKSSFFLPFILFYF